MNIRERIEKNEELYLCEFAAKSSQTKGRLKPEEKDDVRTDYMRDRDRIIHSKSFRRLKHKTQVFFSPLGDHYRTRMTHTLEVSQIARTIAVALELNETLTEAISLAHDLGHTPFGHAGETVLNKKTHGKFKHWFQSLRVVDVLEKDGKGLNLTYEVRDGIVKHSKGRGDILLDKKNSAVTLEGQIVRIADIIAYVNHDIDDAQRAKIIDKIPQRLSSVLGDTHSKRITTMVNSVIKQTKESNYQQILMENDILECLSELRDFLFENVYMSDVIQSEISKSSKVISDLFEYFMEHIDLIPQYGSTKEESVADYISGMTDRYAMDLYYKIFIPKSWAIT
ncbi:MAG: deoxyguanosinetriphosphate triphosphohydrolase [Desulfurella sp.]|uniref:dGTPase n=1 Tax=Desulfurella multipotens TaxID=79269 RepID=A0A1G6PYQ1_9BACT|nr:MULTISPECIES: deoxyguanosinetriphosphate triphosphohydrolase [Desulfurella]AHF97073.1 deoxyguanosinetriphosphate triphosphohydrolase [Desulfurella acetivorans A63]HEX12940.1 deoxyguanosinetriphosphate triphosphohydrolase [Desulfurella acetivorans]PMP68531.1 MAG: deoxyguanosinetriphosphate triphosphohydrolase [Desulfurella multipotens]PMP89413.1 MAG: deoxyguanosinetriphosphate triphosphohydrolase [Desulfurella sp.]SDC84527.1 dGTPase [Desulfurella multipotens]